MTKLYLRVQTDLSPSCWSSSFSTCWCWCRLLPSALQHLQLGFLLVLWDPLQELLPQTDSHCCLPVVLAPGKVPGICWGLVYFSPVIFTNRRWFVSWCLSVLSLCLSSFYFLLQAEFPFQIVMNSSDDGEQHSCFSFSFTIVCSVLFSGDSDLFFPECFISWLFSH